MPEPGRKLTVVGEPPGDRGRRGPGPGVVFVALYALLFGVALWAMRERLPLFRRAPRAPSTGGASASPRSAKTRQALLAGASLSPVVRGEYFRTLSTECCPCGCELNLRDCLVSDQKCVVSSERAAALLDEMR